MFCLKRGETSKLGAYIVMISSFKKQFVKGVAWTTFERFTSYFMQFLIGVILARLLSPNEYGILGILLIFINLSQVLIDSGFGNALIYFNDKNKRDISTVFVFNILISIFLYIILFCSSGLFEIFFRIDGLSLYLDVIALSILFNSLQIVPTSILKIDFKFKQLAFINSTVTIVSGVIGIVLAYTGYGIWALVCQTLVKSVISSISLIVVSKFCFSFHFYKDSFCKVYKYAVNLFGASAMTNIVDETTSFVIGKFLKPYDLGIFSRAKHFMMLPYNTIGSVLLTVLFPSLASVKDDKEQFHKAYVKILRYMAMFSIPLYIYITIESYDIVFIVLGKEWLDVVIVLQIMCISRIFALCAMVTENTLNAIGKSNVYFKLQMTKMLLKMLIILIVVHWGFLWLVVAEALFVMFQFFITNLYSYKTLHAGSWYQIKIFMPYLVGSMIAGALSYILSAYISEVYLSLSCTTIAFFSLYVLSLLSLKQKTYLLELISIINKK